MPRKILLAVGILSIAALLTEHGFSISAKMRPWLVMGEVLLALAYVADRLLMLRRAPDRWRVLRERQFEFLVLAVFIALGLALIGSPALVMRIFQLVHADDPKALLVGLLKLFLLANVLVQMLRLHRRLMSRDVRPEWVLAGSFGMLIVAGTLLLLLPRASANPGKRIGILDAFFTATSASCVTGLSVLDTGTDFSVFGQGVLLALCQAGGLGIMTFVAFLAVTSAESLPVPQMLAFRQLVGARTPAALRRHVLAIVAFSLTIEAAGAACLYACLPDDQDTLSKLGWSVFHSVSAFCNAGFALSSDSLTAFRSHPGAMLTFMTLIILGGLGFLVVMDLLGLQLSRLPLIRAIPWVHRYNKQVPVHRLPIQTRLSVLVTAMLIVVGMLLFWALESSNLLRGESWQNQFWSAAFQSVTTRTAGFNTLPIEGVTPATLLLLMALMIVGASPVSAGGGIKTVTFAVLLFALRALIAGRERVEVFGRALPQRVLLAALAVVLLYVMTAGAGLFALTLFNSEMPLRGLMFEVVSALSTVGLSTGITAQLSDGSRVVVCVLMFVGRVGPLSLLLSVVRMEQPTRYQYPEEDLVVG